ncbi:MAG TPA: TPM domain-containing protein [Thermoanaerobaculia bacterium]|jgi:putative membrane protein|nr:TPM domain-containing protein [Thermoanaerobaculia bacterium]
MDSRRLFSAADEEAIRAAVADAERRSAGEVVPWIAEACDPYPEAAWKAAAIGALAALALGWTARWLAGSWGDPLLWIVLPALAGGALGLALGQLAPLQRLLVDAELMQHRVQRAADSAFLRSEVFATRERTGILIFLALTERRVVVLGDSGINAHVEPREWQTIADDIVAGLRRGRTAAALAAGIEACGELLAERGVPLREEDVNELPDRPRFEGH